MRFLKLQKFPDCYGIKMAQDLTLNVTLGAYFEDAVNTYNYAQNLPDDFFGLIALNAALPLIKEAWKRFGTEFNSEMEKKRGEPYPCKDCPVWGGCMCSAVLLMADKNQWFS